jgi:anti-sigma factor RsiW
VLTCSRFVAGLNEYLDDGLEAAIRAQFDRHAASCRRCRIVSETTRKTVELYRYFPPGEVPLALQLRVRAAVRSLPCARRSAA